MRRAEEQLADAEHHLAHWVRPFRGTPPSKVRAAERKVEKLEARVASLSSGLTK